MHPSHVILDYWFGTVDLKAPPLDDRENLWWVADPIIDRELEKLFASDIRSSADGSNQDWAVAPDSCLALIILLDQFTRSIWRGDARSFEHDPHALRIAKQAVHDGHDAAAHPRKAVFFYMPLMHSESLADQDRCIELFRELHDTAPADCKETLAGNIAFSIKHRDVIAKFDRFPSRNEALGRETTPDETKFLAEHGPGW